MNKFKWRKGIKGGTESERKSEIGRRRFGRTESGRGRGRWVYFLKA